MKSIIIPGKDESKLEIKLGFKSNYILENLALATPPMHSRGALKAEVNIYYISLRRSIQNANSKIHFESIPFKNFIRVDYKGWIMGRAKIIWFLSRIHTWLCSVESMYAENV